MRTRKRSLQPISTLLGVLLTGGLLSGCLGEPEIEERWTILEVTDPLPVATVSPGAVSIPVRGTVIYRSLMVGSVVAEVRVSDTIPYTAVDFDPDRPRLEVLQEVDNILLNSVSAGFAVLPFAGWDHLIQDVDLSVDAVIPPVPAGGGIYLLFYLADVEEVELATGEEVLVVTPFDFTAREVLPIGVELHPDSGGP